MKKLITFKTKVLEKTEFPKIIVCCFVMFIFAARLQSQTWYYNGTGALNNTTSWGANTDGTGTNPPDFTTASQIFIIQNATNIIHNSGNFSVAGTGSKIVMGNPTYATPATPSPAITLAIAAGSQITNPTNVNFEVSIPSSGNHKIIYQNTSAISFGTNNDSNLELVFDGNTLSTTTSRTFGNVSLINNASITMAGASIVLNNLLVEAGSTLSGPLDASGNYIAIKTGGSVTINGTLRVGRQGSVTSPAVGALYTTGVVIPVVAAASQATILFQSTTIPPALTLGANSTIDYYRGLGATQTGVQGITPWAYANLTLSNDATASNRSFAVPGDITVSGNFTINMPTSATITQPSSTTNVRLLPSARLLINSATTFPTNGRLTLQSNATGTASIGSLATGAAITGNVNVQQFIPSAFRKFRFISHPFTTTQALSQLTDNIDITGGTTTGFTTTSTNNPSAFSFITANANGNTPTDGGWAAFTDVTASNWAKGQGIRVLVRGTKGQTNTLNGTDASPAAVTLDMSGVVNTGNQSISLVTGGTGSSAGFNLVGNPYASPVDIGAVLTTATPGVNVANAFYLRNPQTESFITISPIPANYIIPAYTAFFVQALTASTLNFTESNKSTCVSCPTVFRTTTPPPQRVELKAYKDGLEYDNIIFNFDAAYNKNYDKATDAIKLMNNGLSIYSISTDNYKLAVNSLPVTNYTTIPLGIGIPTSYQKQTYQLKVADYTISNAKKVILHDKLMNSYTLLQKDKVIDITIDANNPSNLGENRLALIIEN